MAPPKSMAAVSLHLLSSWNHPCDSVFSAPNTTSCNHAPHTTDPLCPTTTPIPMTFLLNCTAYLDDDRHIDKCNCVSTSPTSPDGYTSYRTSRALAFCSRSGAPIPCAFHFYAPTLDPDRQALSANRSPFSAPRWRPPPKTGFLAHQRSSALIHSNSSPQTPLCAVCSLILLILPRSMRFLSESTSVFV